MTCARGSSDNAATYGKYLFETLLGSEWLPAVPELHERLLADPPARVADIACGQGRSSIELARAYPLVLVDGIDSDHASIEGARKNLEGSGVEERVAFHERVNSVARQRLASAVEESVLLGLTTSHQRA